MKKSNLSIKKSSLSIVIPCFNEEEGIPYLISQLTPAVQELQKRYAVELVFVDDGSTDKTNQLLQQHYGNNPRARIVRHEQNKNLGAALKTGFAHSHGDLVAVLDSDCTYNPNLLSAMLRIMDEHTDIVTVSPYHPQGKVSNVPRHRIFLSKSASFLYRLLLNWDLYTYTAMVRVYRRAVIQKVRLERDDFLGVTELLVKALLQGYTVREMPVELQIRKFGVSKMKTIPLHVIGNHLRLMSLIVRQKWRGES